MVAAIPVSRAGFAQADFCPTHETPVLVCRHTDGSGQRLEEELRADEHQEDPEHRVDELAGEGVAEDEHEGQEEDLYADLDGLAGHPLSVPAVLEVALFRVAVQCSFELLEGSYFRDGRKRVQTRVRR